MYSFRFCRKLKLPNHTHLHSPSKISPFFSYQFLQLNTFQMKSILVLFKPWLYSLFKHLFNTMFSALYKTQSD